MNQPEEKVFQTGEINQPNLKIKLSSQDVKVILCHGIAILRHGIAILRHGTAIPCHRTAIPWHGMNNVTGSDKLFNLTKKTFLPVRWQKISGRSKRTSLYPDEKKILLVFMNSGYVNIMLFPDFETNIYM